MAMPLSSDVRPFHEAKELAILRIINWAQRNNRTVGNLTPSEIRIALKSKT